VLQVSVLRLGIAKTPCFEKVLLQPHRKELKNDRPLAPEGPCQEIEQLADLWEEPLGQIKSVLTRE
jgi:hypothetical protein